ncbi:unnamed protein product [Calicophoron daubneyi]|uniref:Uncharacterized protein n=1 Tax=Calicophoron daubneyi TaxID=300641 RepID=A0AAV2U0B0_CALDB
MSPSLIHYTLLCVFKYLHQQPVANVVLNVLMGPPTTCFNRLRMLLLIAPGPVSDEILCSVRCSSQWLTHSLCWGTLIFGSADRNSYNPSTLFDQWCLKLSMFSSASDSLDDLTSRSYRQLEIRTLAELTQKEVLHQIDRGQAEEDGVKGDSVISSAG